MICEERSWNLRRKESAQIAGRSREPEAFLWANHESQASRHYVGLQWLCCGNIYLYTPTWALAANSPIPGAQHGQDWKVYAVAPIAHMLRSCNAIWYR